MSNSTPVYIASFHDIFEIMAFFQIITYFVNFRVVTEKDSGPGPKFMHAVTKYATKPRQKNQKQWNAEDCVNNSACSAGGGRGSQMAVA